jgi:predicted permease
MAFKTLRFLSRVRGLFGLQKANREFSEEIQTHIELLTERLMQQGASREDAVYAARRQFGNTPLLEQRHREARAFLSLATVLQDVRYGLRMLGKNAGMTSIAVASLALGIGANTAIFTFAKAVLVDALSVPHPDELRLLSYVQGDGSIVQHNWGDFYTDEKGRTVVASFSYPVYQELRRRNHSLGDLFAFIDLGPFEHLSATIAGHAEVVTVELVSGNFFQGIGVGTILGRPIVPEDDATPGGGPVAVISDSFWQRRFNRSPAVIGKTMDVNLTPITIVGVAPRGFTGASHVQAPQDLFLPLSMQPVIFPKPEGSLLSDPDTWWIQIMGRLQPGQSDKRARASLAVSLDQAIRSTMMLTKDRTLPTLLLLPGKRGWNSRSRDLEHPASLLLVLAGLVLLLACANVANLLLARSSSRQREISVRLALGAGKRRILRQMLTESLILSAMGGAAGQLLGYLGRNYLPHLLSPSWGSAALGVRFDWRVFGFTLIITVLTGIAFGLGPAWHATRTTVKSGLKAGAMTTTHHRKGLAGKALVIFQVALCMLLLVGAGLFVRTLANLDALDPGFNKNGLLLFALEPPPQRYPAPHDVEVIHRLEERIGSLPGVASITLSKEALLAESRSSRDFLLDGRTNNNGRAPNAYFNSVGQIFFAAMGIPVLYGRSFDFRDTPTSPVVAIINQSLAKREFAGTNPLGKTFRMKEGQQQYQIVGICADAKYGWLRDDPPATFYVLYSQQKDARGGMTFEVRTKGDPRGLSDAIRGAVESVDKDLPLIDVRTEKEQIDATLAPERSFSFVTSGFGMVALLLAGIGVYGVMASAVARRVNEIGVRMALGARADQVLRMVLGEVMSLALTGIAAGLGAALLLTRFLNSMLFGLRPTDPLTLASAALLLMAVAMLAGWTPARRASLIQPVQALRHE